MQESIGVGRSLQQLITALLPFPRKRVEIDHYGGASQNP
jgi:hypothetical protein